MPSEDILNDSLLSSDTSTTNSNILNYDSSEIKNDTIISKQKKDSIAEHIKKNIPDNELKNKIGAYGANDSLAKEKMKDAGTDKAKELIPNSELKNKIGEYGGNDSLAKEKIKDAIPGNDLKNKIGEYSGNDSLAKAKLKNAAKDKIQSVVPDVNAKDKLNSTKESLLTRKDSLLSLQKNKIKSFSPKAFAIKQYKAIQPHGNISLGYEYGVLPSVVGAHYPAGGYKTEGNVSFLLLNLPLEFNYSYTDIKNTIGINNYFRLSYDANRYRDQMEDKLNVKDKLMAEQLNKLQLQQAELKQKMEYLSFLQKNPTYNTAAIEKVKAKVPTDLKDSLQMPTALPTGVDSLNMASMPSQPSASPIPSSLQIPGSIPNGDSLKGNVAGKIPQENNTAQNVSISDTSKFSSMKGNTNEKLDRYKIKKNKSDSVETENDSICVVNDSIHQMEKDTLAKADSVEKENKLKKRKAEVSEQLEEVKTKYDSINDKVVKIQKEIEYIKAVKENPMIVANPYLSKVQSFMRSIKKVEIGLCHPTNSTFLVNNIPLQGINIEYGTDEKFITACYGTTVNALLYNTNTIQGAVQGARNFYNYFDFGNLSAGRKIFSLKGGIGKVDDSHLYAGFLIGKGRSDYLSPLADVSSSYSKESNVVAELDAKYRFTDNISIDAIIGKSSIKEEDLSVEQLKRGVNELFSNYRSYAFFGRLNIAITKTKTKLTFTTRWVDPYFKSFGVGFLRSDNLRYEVKADQIITKKIRYTVAYRREEDNILRLFNYTNNLQSINNSLSIKLSRQINIRLNYVPLFRELKSSEITVKDKNQIATVMFSYTPRPRKASAMFNALYSKYIISGDTAAINFENIAYSHMLQWKSGFKTGLNVSWFKNSLKDSLNNDTYLGVLDAGYGFKKGGSFSVGGKMAWKQGLEPQYGFVVKFSFKVYKGLFWEAEAEKILIGDYYNSFIISEIEKFPYYCNTRLVLKF